MKTFAQLVKVSRPGQWYKNIVIFIALFFTAQLFNLDEFGLTLLGFVSLCLISSANYIINDIIDAREDRKHPEKRNRPIAAGKLKIWVAALFAAVLFSVSLFIAYSLSAQFLMTVSSIFILTQIYSLWLKKEPFLDVIIIGVNFVLRAVSGAFIINVEISPWLIICAFFLALFLAFGKRRADMALLGKNAVQHRKVYRYYTLQQLDMLIASVMATLIIAYAFYTFLKSADQLIMTLPIVVYGLYRYHYLISSGAKTARQPQHMMTDFRIMLSVLIWCLVVFGSIYLK